MCTFTPMKLIPLLISFVIPSLCWANTDSLKNVIATSQNSIEKIDALNQLGKKLYWSDNEASRNYLLQSFDLLQAENYPQGYAEALNVYGNAVMVIGYFPESRDSLNKAVLAFQKLHDNKNEARSLMDIATSYYYEGNTDTALFYCEMALPKLDSFPLKKAKLYNNMGIFSKKSGNYSAATDYYLKALSFFIEVQDTALIIATQNNIGAMFTKYQQFDKAFNYHNDAVKLSEMTHDKQGLARGYAGIALAQDYLMQYETAIENNEKAISLFKELGLQKDLLSIQYNLASVYYSLGQNDKALPLFDTLLYQFKAINATVEVAACINTIGLIYYDKKELDSATIYLEQAFQLQQYIDDPTMLKNMLISLSELYQSKGELEKAMNASKRYESIKDSLHNLEEAERIAQKEALFRYENKTVELKITESHLSSEKTITKSLDKNYLFIIISVIIVGVLVVIFARTYSGKRKESKQLIALKNEVINKFTSLENAYSEILINLEKSQPDSSSNSHKWLSLLSKRELEVLTCLSVGLADSEISEKLFVSKATVNSHCNRIYKKLKVKNRSEAARLAREINLT